MQALVFHQPQEISLETLPEPKIHDHDVLIQVTACGICGSDLHGYLGHSARRNAHVPLVMGHEFAGRIAEVGASVQHLRVGDRVVVHPQIYCGTCRACRAGLQNICPNMSVLGIELPGAFAEYVAVPANRVFALPDDLPDVSGALVETLAVEVHLFRAFYKPMTHTVVVLGAGAQGLLAAELARLNGASQVIITDVIPQRLAYAAQHGATHTIQADQQDAVALVKQATDEWGADFIVDAAGTPQTRQQGVAMLAPGGTLALVGLGKGETTLNFVPVVGRELNIQGSYCYGDGDFQRALELLTSRQMVVDSMVHTAPLREGVEYFQRMIEEPASIIKTVLVPN
jgi:2-desacetyl-2-hydroxyethyl bacteriochlorophyllide A dehydrogenase